MASGTYRDGLSRVMPTIFVAGPAKSGSTFLWECIQQSFHPSRVCAGSDVRAWADLPCEGKRFVLPALGADVAQPACLRFQKESSFWRYWGRKPQVTWRRYGGPRVALAEWEQHGGACGGRRRAAARRAAAAAAAGRGGPRSLAGHRAMEDMCMQDVRCGGAADGGRLPYAAAVPAECKSRCTPCELHAGWMNNVDEPCSIPPYMCDSPTCANAAYVPKAVRRANFSAHHARAFSMTAFASLAALSDANVTAGRLDSLEGNPGLYQTPTRHARALASLTTPAGQRRLRFVVGLRDPLDLAFSLWSFLSSIGQEGRRVELRFSRALAALQACNDTLAERPILLLDLPPAELLAYRTCLDDRPRSKQHFYLYGGLYGLHLLGWLHLGFRGPQFLFVKMASLPRDASQATALQAELAAFLALPPPPGGGGACLSATMITRKAQKLRAHNATVSEVKRAFGASETAASVRRFLEGHQALLDALIRRERIRVY